MASYTAEGIVIKRLNLGEADKLVTLFTKTHGKVTLVAKGLRKPTSKRAGSLELFNRVRFHAVRGRGELDTLTEVEPTNSFSAWRKHLGRVSLAYQLAEVIDKITPDRDPHPEIFQILDSSLSKIGSLGADWKSEIGDWLLEVTRELGYWPKDREFAGDVYEFLEKILSRPLNSPKLLTKLSHLRVNSSK